MKSACSEKTKLPRGERALAKGVWNEVKNHAITMSGMVKSLVADGTLKGRSCAKERCTA